MPKYHVTVTYTTINTYQIEADSKQEARYFALDTEGILIHTEEEEKEVSVEEIENNHVSPLERRGLTEPSL